MARKTKEEAQATREGILDAAQLCFHEYGVAGTSLAMIGARAGFTRGAVYWHFKNKTEVLTAMIDRERVPFIERLRRTTSAKRTTPILDLRSALLVSFQELSEDERLRNMMEIMLRNDLSVESQAMQALQLEASREELGIFAAAFQRARELGQLREGVDVDTVARIVSTSLTGVLYSAMLEPELFEIQRDGAQTLDAILSAFVQPGVFTPGAPPTALPTDDDA
ncbi:TetR family transcriptional regulator [Stenotrophomonas rhizophila]|uniref:TetR family transcriptional regulator n=1 Tax=Stenotrophomonas TaxID=40323 RepID=UPI000F4BDD0F|nr:MULTISPECIES: TetR family transcriptional regulator [Stenotrophomonas]MCW6027966.1 TetR family transcriptional regulator [Stenotrophomonas sp. SRS1]ROP76538.1 TetR family transcriptional regulator [Stenotrophomonas rhizophila]